MSKALKAASWGALALGALFALFHDTLYRKVALAAVEHVTGMRVEIAGAFDVVHTAPLSITAQGLVLHGEGTRPSITRIDQLAVTLRLRELIAGRAHIEQLVIRGADATLALPALTPPSLSRRTTAVASGLPLVERLDVEEVSITIDVGEAAPARVIRIASLTLGTGSRGRIEISGSGAFDGERGALDGSFGSIESLLAQDSPWPIALDLQVPGWTLAARARGSIERPLDGDGLRLEIGLDLADAQPMMRANLPDLPPGLSIAGQALLTGTIAAPVLAELWLTVSEAGTQTLRAEGRVGDLRAADDLDLALSVAADSALAGWLPRRAGIPLDAIGGRARLQSSAGRYSIGSLDAQGRGADGLVLGATGRISVETAQTGQVTATAVDLRLEASATAATLADRAPRWLDAATVIAASAALRGDADDLVLDDLRLTLDGDPAFTMEVVGQVALGAASTLRARTMELPALLARGAALDVDLGGPSLGALEALLGPPPFEPGPWTLRARLEGRDGALPATRMTLGAGVSGGARLLAEGTFPDVLTLFTSAPDRLRGLRADGTITAPSTSALGAVFGLRAADLGRVDASVSLAVDDHWSLPALSASVTNDDGLQISLNGAVPEIGSAARFAGQVSVRAASTAIAVALAGARAPALQDVALDARGDLVLGSERHEYSGTVKLGETLLETTLALSTDGARPALSGTIQTALARVQDLAPGPVKADSPAAPDPRQLPLHWLGVVDLDLDLRAARIEGGRVAMRDFAAHLALEDRRLVLDPVTVRHEEGALELALQVDARTEPVSHALRLEGNDISLGAVVALVERLPEGVEGRATLDVDLTARGGTWREVLASLDGRYGQVIEDGVLPGRNIDALAMLGMRVTQLFLSALESKTDHTTFDCSIVQLVAEQGVLRTEALYLSTPKLIAAGAGTVDLRERTVDVVLRANSKRRALFAASPTLRVSGPLDALRLETDVSAATAGLAVEAAGFVAFPPITLPLAALGDLVGLAPTEPDSPCARTTSEQRDDR